MMLLVRRDGGDLIKRRLFMDFRRHCVFNMSEAQITHRDLIVSGCSSAVILQLCALLYEHFLVCLLTLLAFTSKGSGAPLVLSAHAVPPLAIRFWHSSSCSGHGGFTPAAFILQRKPLAGLKLTTFLHASSRARKLNIDFCKPCRRRRWRCRS